MPRSPLALFRHLVEGVAIGVANIIPGVSGGTMALIFGIYERLIAAASGGVTAGVALLRGDFTGFREGLRALPWSFLVPLVIGMVATPFLGAGILERLLDESPVAMRALFLGLIVGSLPIPWDRISRKTALTAGLILAGTVAAWVLAGLSPREIIDPSALQIFLVAGLAISAMVLPGVSGSFLLLVLGMYAPTLRALDTLDIPYLVAFSAGAAAGLAVFSVLLNWLLKTRHDATMAVLVGLMLGSLRALWPWQAEGGLALPGAGDSLTWPLLLFVIGLVVTGGLTAWELRRSRRAGGADSD
jgi:putative membrane protein